MVNKSTVNYARQTTIPRAECDEQVEQRMQQNNRSGKGGYLWPNTNKRFPKPYERGVNTVKINNASKKQCTEEVASSPSTSKQWLRKYKSLYTINNIYLVDLRDELLSTDQDISREEHVHTKCPIVNVYINNCLIKMLLDTGSQLSVLNATLVHQNKNHLF